MIHSKPFPKLFIFSLLLCSLGCELNPLPNINPDIDVGIEIEAGIMMAGADVPLAGQMNVAGEAIAGEVAAGEITGGEVVAGEITGGEVVAGEITGGEVVAGEIMGGEVVAGEIMGGEIVAGEVMGGERTGGELAAGESMEGGSQAGEVMGGEAAGDMMFDEAVSQIGDRLEFDDTVQMDSVTVHQFRVDQELGIRLRVMGQSGELCPENVDSMLALYRVEGAGRILVSRNDDYMSPEHFCSEIISTISAGEYQAEVTGYGGQAIDNYRLMIEFYPALSANDLCDLDSLNAGICPQDYLCLANRCALIRPQLDVVTATKTSESLYLHVEGSDADRDAAYMNLSLFDELGNELVIDELGETIYYTYIPEGEAPLNSGLADFNFDYISTLPNLDFASELSVEIEDLSGNVSESLLVPINMHPILSEGEVCLINGMSGLCGDGLTCRIDQQNLNASCQTSVAPSIIEAKISPRVEDLVLKAVGRDADRDIIGLTVTLYDVEGQTIFGMGGMNREFVETLTQVEVDELNQAYFVTLEGAFVPNTVAAEIGLIDNTGLESQVLLVQLSDLPQQDQNEACDIQQLQNECAEGICYPNGESNNLRNGLLGICRVNLPQREEFCDYEFGCAEGFVCYGPSNNGNLRERFQTCMRACDANAEIDGCEQDELCLPDIDWASLGNTEVPSPGVCLITDQCFAGSETHGCQEADSTCLRVANITICIDISSIPNEQRSNLGDPCTGVNQVCDQGLHCELGVCRQPCDETNLCGVDQTCRTFDEVYYDDSTVQYATCMEICDPVGQDCAEGQSCTLFQSESSQGRLSICRDEASGTLTDGDACTLNLDDNYWGNCSADHFCTQLFRDDTDECLPICTTDDVSACTGQRVCALDILGTPDVGLCTGQCEFFNGQGCQANQSCLVGIQGQNAEQETIISGVCINNPNRGEQSTGTPCVYDQLNNTSNCQAAHLCVDLDQDSNDECVAMCQAGNLEHSCPLNSTCVNILNDGSYLFGEELSTLGLCVPNPPMP